MAVHTMQFYQSSFAPVGRYMIDASVVAGQVLIRSTVDSSAGEVVNATTTGAAHFMGLAMTAVTYSATQADMVGLEKYPKGTVGILVDPFAPIDFPVAGGATAGTALATTAPANILTNTVASAGGTLISAAEVGTVTFSGGLIMGYRGANAGYLRRISAHSNSTSTTVEVPFPYAIAVNDTFIRVPWSKATITVQLTSNLVEADGTIVYATGAPFRVTDVLFDLRRGKAVVRALSGDHFFNPIA